jgi:hypothetical protein
MNEKILPRKAICYRLPHEAYPQTVIKILRNLSSIAFVKAGQGVPSSSKPIFMGKTVHTCEEIVICQ